MREIQPISGVCVWHGRETASSSRWRRRLSDAQLAEIERAVRQASARGLGWQTSLQRRVYEPSVPEIHRRLCRRMLWFASDARTGRSMGQWPGVGSRAP